MKTARKYCCRKLQIGHEKDNLKLLYNSLPEGMCDNEYESLEQAVNDVETFSILSPDKYTTSTGSSGVHRLSLPAYSRY